MNILASLCWRGAGVLIMSALLSPPATAAILCAVDFTNGDPAAATNCNYPHVDRPANICLGSIVNAMVKAAKNIAVCPTFTVTFGPGTYDFSQEPKLVHKAQAVFDMGKVVNLDTGSQNRLIITGAPFAGIPTNYGATPNLPPTTLITNNELEAFDGTSLTNMSHITIQNMTLKVAQTAAAAGSRTGGATPTFGQDVYTMTQGHVVNYPGDGNGGLPFQVVIDIQPGFPYPTPLLDPANYNGRAMQAYTDDPANPALLPTISHSVVPWGDEGAFVHCPAASQHRVKSQGVLYKTCAPTQSPTNPQRWTFYLDQDRWPIDARPGHNLVCIKTKPVWGNSYTFNAHSGFSHDIVFDHIMWVGVARGVFRGGVTGVTVKNSSIMRPPPIHGQAPCISSSKGGPQFGQPGDPPTFGNTVTNILAIGTGDDTVGFFNDIGTVADGNESSVTNMTNYDTFGRDVYLQSSPQVYVADPDGTCNYSVAGAGNTFIHASPFPNMYWGTLYFPRANPLNCLIPPDIGGVYYYHP